MADEKTSKLEPASADFWGFNFGTNPADGPQRKRYWKGKVRLMQVQNGSIVAYAESASHMPYLRDLLDALEEANFIPEDSPTVLTWLNFPHFGDNHHFRRMFTFHNYGHEDSSVEEISDSYGVELDLSRSAMSGTWSSVSKVPWNQRAAGQICLEIAVGVAAGVGTQATLGILRTGLKKVSDKLRTRHEVDDVTQPEEDDWRSRGYL
jgi:hypothetical protein